MPRMTQAEYDAYQNRRRLRSPIPEQAVRDNPLGADGRKETGQARIVVRITSCRQRLLDPDNLSGGTKYLVDCLRYAGLIPNDRPQDIVLTVEQRLVSKPDCCTIIELLPEESRD